MGKAQSKRSVDITTETKKGTEDEITEKMEKIEDLDKKEVVNGDATLSEKRDPEKKDTEEVENDKDMTTEKDVDVQASGDAVESQNVAETSKDEGGSATAEEISPLADESIKKSKKEKVKKKWSFRSISFGKKDKQKPAKSEDAAEDGIAATNGADGDEKTNDPEKDKSANETEEKTKENHENGNSTPQELNGGEQNEDKPSDEKSNDITANTTNNTTTTETCEPVQKETAAVTSELSEKTESTAVINETKISENATVDDASKNGNGIDEKINATDQESQKIDVTNTSVEAPLDKTSTLASAVTNESSVTTNGEVVDEIHQNGNHGGSEQEYIEKSKAQIEVNINTDNKVSAATLDSISSTSINPSNVQIHDHDLNASSEKPDERIQINIDESESVIQKSTVTELNSSSVDDQSSLSENVGSMVDVKSNLQIEVSADLTSEATDNEKENLVVDTAPPPLPISPPPSQVSVFAFTNSEESVEDSTKTEKFEPTFNNIKMEAEKYIPLSLPPVTEIVNSQETETMPSEIIDERKTYEQALQTHVDQEANNNLEIIRQEDEVEKETSICKDINKDDEVLSAGHFEKSQIEEETSVAVAAAVIDEITEIAAEIVNQQLKCNEEQITDKFSSQSNEERKEEDEDNENIVVVECNDNKVQNDKDLGDDQEYVCEVSNSSNESLLVLEQTKNITNECSLDFTTSDSIQQDQDEMNSIIKSDNHLDPTKDFATAKDIKDNVTVAEITQDLSVTCE